MSDNTDIQRTLQPSDDFLELAVTDPFDLFVDGPLVDFLEAITDFPMTVLGHGD